MISWLIGNKINDKKNTCVTSGPCRVLGSDLGIPSAGPQGLQATVLGKAMASWLV